MHKHHVHVSRQMPWGDLVEIRIGHQGATGLFAMQPATIDKVEPGAYVEPALKLDEQQVQLLMDELWAAGYRPTRAEPVKVESEAKQAHIDDLRKLVHGSVEALQKIAVEGMGIR